MCAVSLVVLLLLHERPSANALSYQRVSPCVTYGWWLTHLAHGVDSGTDAILRNGMVGTHAGVEAAGVSWVRREPQPSIHAIAPTRFALTKNQASAGDHIREGHGERVTMAVDPKGSFAQMQQQRKTVNVHSMTGSVAFQLNQLHTRSGHPSFVVLLTTYNEASRTRMYEKRLMWWLSNCTLPIYVVDSYNAPFSEHLKSIRKFREYHFDQTSVLGPGPKTAYEKTRSEILSLKNAFQVFKDEWAHYDYVLKITGKYVLPTLPSAFATMSKGSAFIVQSDHYDLSSSRPGWVGTECLGFDAKRMGELIAEIEMQWPQLMENKVAMLLQGGDRYSHQRLPPMEVPEAYQIARGDSNVLKLL
jgi:hypothetical protein